MMRKILTLNAGSSSLKFKIFDIVADSTTHTTVVQPVAWGICERVGDPLSSCFKATFCSPEKQERHTDLQAAFSDHTAAMHLVSEYLTETFGNGIKEQVVGVGHRVVHGKDVSRAVKATPAVLDLIAEASDLAPLHNPANVDGIIAAKHIFPDATQVAVFDTAFHSTMPPRNYMYALPQHVVDSYHLRKYGFHGTSYKYISQRAARMVGKTEETFSGILCHLGAGASLCVVQDGKSLDTTMGLTPLPGLLMATRSGDIDPSVVTYLVNKGMDARSVETMLNKESGFLGLCGASDIRDVHRLADTGDTRARAALEMFASRVKKYIGSYLVELEGRVDALVFTAGIGEHDSRMRRMICDGLQWTGIDISDALNTSLSSSNRIISSDVSKIPILVVPTDEELSIAEQTLACLQE